MANGLQVITARLFDSLVRGDRSVSSSTGQIFALFVGDVLALRITVAFGQPEVNNVDLVLGEFGATNEEVVGLDVPVDNALFVHFLDALHELDGDEEAGFQVEGALARREEVFQGGAQHVHHHHVEGLVRTAVVRPDVVQLGHESLASQLVN